MPCSPCGRRAPVFHPFMEGTFRELRDLHSRGGHQARAATFVARPIDGPDRANQRAGSRIRPMRAMRREFPPTALGQRRRSVLPLSSWPMRLSERA
jgi:hypothetical protein